MAAATETKACEIVDCGPSAELIAALLNPLGRYQVHVQGIMAGDAMTSLLLDIRALVRMDESMDTYALVCVHEERGPCVITIPWMELPKADLTGLKLTFHGADFIRENMRIKLD